MLVEFGQIRPQVTDVLHLLHQDLVKTVYVVLNIGLRLLNVLQKAHVLLDDIDDVINVLPVL